MKPIDWPRIFADPAVIEPHFDRLHARIKQWPALCQLCAITGDPLESFDRALMLQVRDFLLLVGRKEWDSAESVYWEIQQHRQRIMETKVLPTKSKTQSAY